MRLGKRSGSRRMEDQKGQNEYRRKAKKEGKKFNLPPTLPKLRIPWNEEKIDKKPHKVL